jgi:ribosomal protein S18 acetylase RimI-like enzyme
MIDVRTVVADDWQRWRDLRLAALADAPQAFGSRLADWRDAAEDRWRERLSIPGSVNLVAWLDGEPVGMASGVPEPGGAAELISMWVAPPGRGHGVGDALVRRVVQWAAASGARELRLSVADGNDPAAGLYRRNGFELTGELGDLMPDGVHREHVMARRLDPPA